MGTPVSGERFEREIMGRAMSLRLADGRLVQAQYQPDGTAAYIGTPFQRSGRWRPWDKGFCALYPWIGASPAVSRTYGGSPDAEAIAATRCARRTAIMFCSTRAASTSLPFRP